MDWRTWHIAVRAIDAAIAFQWAQHGFAMCAVIEKLARIGRHGVSGLPSTLWASEGGKKLGHAGPIAFIIWASKWGRIAESAMNAVAAQSRMKVALVGGERVQDSSSRH